MEMKNTRVKAVPKKLKRDVNSPKSNSSSRADSKISRRIAQLESKLHNSIDIDASGWSIGNNYKYSLFDGIVQRKIEKLDMEIAKLKDDIVKLQNNGRNFVIGTYTTTQANDSKSSFEEFKVNLKETRIK